MEILIIEDEENLSKAMEISLRKEKNSVYLSKNRKEALEILKEKNIFLIFLDYKLPDSNGIEILKEIKESYPETEVILMTAYGTIEMAVEAMKNGAIDFIKKPFSPEDLFLRLDIFKSSKFFSKREKFNEIVTENKEMIRILDEAKKVSSTKATILIRGES